MPQPDTDWEQSTFPDGLQGLSRWFQGFICRLWQGEDGRWWYFAGRTWWDELPDGRFNHGCSRIGDEWCDSREKAVARCYERIENVMKRRAEGNSYQLAGAK